MHLLRWTLQGLKFHHKPIKSRLPLLGIKLWLLLILEVVSFLIEFDYVCKHSARNLLAFVELHKNRKSRNNSKNKVISVTIKLSFFNLIAKVYKYISTWWWWFLKTKLYLNTKQVSCRLIILFFIKRQLLLPRCNLYTYHLSAVLPSKNLRNIEVL